MAMKMDLTTIIEQIETGDQDGAWTALQSFNEEMNHCFTFSREDERDRQHLGELVLGFLNKELAPSSQLACLETVRILSRDQHCLDPFTSQSAMATLARYAHIATPASHLRGDGPVEDDGGEDNEVNEESEVVMETQEEQEVIAEALKSICNILLHSETGQVVAADLHLITGVSERLKVCHDPTGNHEVCFFMLRLTFLLTALRVDVRAQLAQELHGVGLLGQQLDAILGLCWQETLQPARAGFENVPAKDLPPLSPQQAELAMEVLKILFNLTFDTATRVTKEEDAAQYKHLGAILTHCLMSHVDGEEQSEEFHSHTVNLLGNLPVPCLDVLLMPQVQPGSTEYMGLNMEAVDALLELLEKRLEQGRRLKETLLPSLNLLTQIAQNHRETRKYLRSKVLPPLRDVKNRPETGGTLRNKLVRLMTHIDTDVKDRAAEFLFVLCKENVSRFIKYTGYGNAAGLLAARGLLQAGKDPGVYSEDEDSETEEYREAKNYINPITGAVEEEQPDPMEGMTEEQKEYEAMKLVSMFNKLSRTNVIQPMQLGVDGQMRTLTLEDVETQAPNHLSLPEQPVKSDSEDDDDA